MICTAENWFTDSVIVSYYQEGLMSLLVIFALGVYVFDVRSHLGNSYDRESRVKSE